MALYTDTTHTLVRQAAEGDTAAADRLVRRSEALVRHLVGRRVSRDHPDFADLCQVGRLAVIGAVRTWSPAGGASFSTYAHRAVVWAIKDELRRLAGEPTFDDPDAIGRVPQPPEDDDAPSALPSWLRRAFDALPPDQRRAIGLVFGFDSPGPMSVRDAADHLGWKYSRTRSLYDRGLAALSATAPAATAAA